MKIEFIPLISFVIAITFSPCPNNITSASMGIVYGYRKTINFLLDVASGFFLVMIICAFHSSTLLSVIPASEKYLRWIGTQFFKTMQGG